MKSTGALDIEQLLGRGTIHPFPARMAPGLAVAEISRLKKASRVLDPMVGSGTVVALARARGHQAIGFDVDPLAALVARVWVRTIDVVELRGVAARVLQRASRLANDVRDGYPAGADSETQRFVRYWFDGNARKQLAALATAIADVHVSDIREALWCAFSRQIIVKQAGVSLARDLAHSRPHRAFTRAPRRPLDGFLSAVERVAAGCVQSTSKRRGPPATVHLGDARQLSVEDASIDLVFTSPPYLNAIDYLRCSKFSLVWMGYSIAELRSVRANSIGTEVSQAPDVMHDVALSYIRLRPSLAARQQGILRRYITDTSCALRELSRVLAPNGKVIYVVGENTIRGTYIPTGKLVEGLAAGVGLQLKTKRFRELPENCRYLPPPGRRRTTMDSRMRREVVLTFEHK